MHRSMWRLALMVVVACGFTGFAASSMAAQEGPPAHPTHIHEGTCEQLDPNPAFPLTDVAAVAPDVPAGAVEVSETSVDVTLDELLASPHAINAHESAENAATYIACGEIEGVVVDDRLAIALQTQNDSGYAGVAVLESAGAAGTDVTVYLAPGLADPASAAVPVADEDVAAGEVVVPIFGLSFEPEVLEIAVGTTVTWVNEGTAPHSATSNDGVWDSDILSQGDAFSFTFDQPGTFAYFCTVHPSMTAQVVVTAP